MIKKGNELDLISDKIAVLRHAISQNGKLGRFNINKDFEGLIMDLLNLAYKHDLVDLNENKSNYPGLDLGEKGKIAFQISSEKTSDKVNETLSIVIAKEHYKIFPSINIFVLGSKQLTYSIKVDTSLYFPFHEKQNIFDFDDLLKRISHCSPTIVSSILRLLESQMTETISLLELPSTEKREHILDIGSALSSSKMTYFRYGKFTIELHDGNYSAPKIYEFLNKKLSTNASKQFLPIFFQTFFDSHTTATIKYRRSLGENGASNNFKESVFQIEANRITFETAQYIDKPDIISNLNEEVGGLISVLFALEGLYGYQRLDVNVIFELSTNGNLFYTPQNSIFSLNREMLSYSLNPDTFRIECQLHNLENYKIMELMQDIIYAFPSEKPFFGEHKPFMTMDDNNQQTALNTLRNYINPSEF